jgi:hypothetical protein
VSLTLLVLSPELEGVALDFFFFFSFSHPGGFRRRETRERDKVLWLCSCPFIWRRKQPEDSRENRVTKSFEQLFSTFDFLHFCDGSLVKECNMSKVV